MRAGSASCWSRRVFEPRPCVPTASSGHEPAERCTSTSASVVSGRYEITRFIARGGMGEVYAAHDRHAGRGDRAQGLVAAGVGAGTAPSPDSGPRCSSRAAWPIRTCCGCSTSDRPDPTGRRRRRRGPVPDHAAAARARRCARAIRRAGPLAPPRSGAWPATCSPRSAPPTKSGSSTATSSPTTSCWFRPPPARRAPWSWISASRRQSPPTRRPAKTAKPLVAGTLGYMAPGAALRRRGHRGRRTSTRSASSSTRC